MLKDRTNAPVAPPQKVFSRRSKPKEVSEEQQQQQEQKPPTPAAKTPVSASPSPLPSPADVPLDLCSQPVKQWLRKLHRNRRGSVLLPYPCYLGDREFTGAKGTLALLTQQQLANKRVAGKHAKQRVAAYAEFLDSMASYFNEVDSFELAVESPGPMAKLRRAMPLLQQQSKPSTPSFESESHEREKASPQPEHSAASTQAAETAECRHSCDADADADDATSQLPVQQDMEPTAHHSLLCDSGSSDLEPEHTHEDGANDYAPELGATSDASCPPDLTNNSSDDALDGSPCQEAAGSQDWRDGDRKQSSSRASVGFSSLSMSEAGGRRSSAAPREVRRASAQVPVHAPEEGRRSSTQVPSAHGPSEGRRSSVHVRSTHDGRRSSILVPMPSGHDAERRSSVLAPMDPVDGRRSSVHVPMHGAASEGRRSSVHVPLDGRRSSTQASMSVLLEAFQPSRRSSACMLAPTAQGHLLAEAAIPEGEEGEEEEEEETISAEESYQSMRHGDIALSDQLGRLSLTNKDGVLEEEEEEASGHDQLGVAEAVDGFASPPIGAADALLAPMQQLLQICGQSVDLDSIPTMEELIGSQAELKRIVKIGEGTYGEAFKHDRIVFKIIPIDGDQLVNQAVQKKAGEMVAEVAISLTLSDLKGGCKDSGKLQPNTTTAFVETFKVGVCCGRYPRELVKAWHAWDKRHRSESDPVDSLAPDQAFLVISMADCGSDLEKFPMPGGYDQAVSLMVQVAFALAVAEEAVEFEHRDLHWGNVMVKPAESTTTVFRLRGVDIQVQTHGVNACIIDFTASRLRTMTQQLAFCDLSQDPELFDGPKGNVQCDTYRHMQKLNSDDWASSHMATNCLWMSYLAEIMATEKLVTAGTKSSRGVAQQKKVLREFRKRAVQYNSCSEMVLVDPLFQGLWAVQGQAG